MTLREMPVDFTRKVQSVTPHDQGFDVTFACGHKVWFAARPQSAAYNCSICFAGWYERVKALKVKAGGAA
jgi:hypothetical protein